MGTRLREQIWDVDEKKRGTEEEIRNEEGEIRKMEEEIGKVEEEIRKVEMNFEQALNQEEGITSYPGCCGGRKICNSLGTRLEEGINMQSGKDTLQSQHLLCLLCWASVILIRQFLSYLVQCRQGQSPVDPLQLETLK